MSLSAKTFPGECNFEELGALFRLRSRDTLVRKYACHLPLGVLVDFVGVVLYLRLIACFLFLVIGADTAVRRHFQAFRRQRNMSRPMKFTA